MRLEEKLGLSGCAPHTEFDEQALLAVEKIMRIFMSSKLPAHYDVSGSTATLGYRDRKIVLTTRKSHDIQGGIDNYGAIMHGYRAGSETPACVIRANQSPYFENALRFLGLKPVHQRKRYIKK